MPAEEYGAQDSVTTNENTADTIMTFWRYAGEKIAHQIPREMGIDYEKGNIQLFYSIPESWGARTTLEWKSIKVLDTESANAIIADTTVWSESGLGQWDLKHAVKFSSEADGSTQYLLIAYHDSQKPRVSVAKLNPGSGLYRHTPIFGLEQSVIRDGGTTGFRTPDSNGLTYAIFRPERDSIGRPSVLIINGQPQVIDGQEEIIEKERHANADGDSNISDTFGFLTHTDSHEQYPFPLIHIQATAEQKELWQLEQDEYDAEQADW